MDNLPAKSAIVEIIGLTVDVVRTEAASLRYFDRLGAFATAVRETLGMPIPEALRATALAAAGAADSAGVTLAWRSPTETLLLCNDPAAFAEFQERLAPAADGCMVDQTGGLRVFRVQGPRGGDLLRRMGAATAIPELGEARGGRLAEVHVTTVCVRPGEVLLLVERAYADHLAEWIRATAADFKSTALSSDPFATRGR